MFRSYAWGYKTRAAAVDAIEAMFAECEISAADQPRVNTYKNKNNETRYSVELRDA